ncbi:MAG: hypothetical protein IJC99_03270 [Clostridia bacterium]|nr:hypothetical protein [Clostridia bacterium]
MGKYLAALAPFVIGALCIIFGICNRMGNISSLHSYHRYRVSVADRLPFGKLVGTGMLIIGGSLLAFGVCMLLFTLYEVLFLPVIGAVLLLLGIGVGLGISFYAMIKYNKGIF